MSDEPRTLDYGSGESARRWWEPTPAAFVGLLVAIGLVVALLAFAYWIGSGLAEID